MKELGTEKVIIKVSPHPLAFAGVITLWTYALAVTLATWIYSDRISSYVNSLPLIGKFLSAYSPYILVSIAIVIPFLTYSVIKISWRHVLIAFLITILPPPIYGYFHAQLWYVFPTLITFSLIALIIIEIHRRAHKYIITERRIIFTYKGLFKTVRRDLVYSRISDLILEKSFLGKLFNFGNVVPITSSGIGSGEDLSAAAAGIGGGKGVKVGAAVIAGRGVKVPRSRSFYILYNVPHPERVYEALINAIKASEEAPYLKKLVEMSGGKHGDSNS